MTDSEHHSRDRNPIAGSLEPRDQELIAAFIDQRLSPEDRTAFMRRLDENEALYEVFAETVRFRDQQAGRPAKVLRHPRSRARWLMPAVAAAVLVVAAAALVVRGLWEERYAESLVASGGLDTSPGGDWYAPSWAVTRGISATLPEADAAFRAGVLAMDLEVALRLELGEDSFILIRQLEAVLDEIDLSEALQVFYGRLGTRLEAGAPGAELRELAARADGLFAGQFPELERAYRLGRWVEAGKLAARSGNRELLASRSFRRDLRSLGRESWDPPVVAALETAAGLLAAPANRLDLRGLEAAFVAILAEG